MVVYVVTSKLDGHVIDIYSSLDKAEDGIDTAARHGYTSDELYVVVREVDPPADGHPEGQGE